VPWLSLCLFINIIKAVMIIIQLFYCSQLTLTVSLYSIKDSSHKLHHETLHTTTGRRLSILEHWYWDSLTSVATQHLPLATTAVRVARTIIDGTRAQKHSVQCCYTEHQKVVSIYLKIRAVVACAIEFDHHFTLKLQSRQRTWKSHTAALAPM